MNASVAGTFGHFASSPGLKASSNATAARSRRHAGRYGDGGQVELAADNCRDREKVVGVLRSSRDRRRPTTSRTPSGRPRSASVPVAGPHPVALEDRAGLDEVGHDLLGEERVPVGLVVQCGDELGWCVVTGAIVEQRADRLLVEPAERHPLDAGVASEVSEQLGSADGGGRHRCRGRCPARASARLVRCSRSTGAAPASPDRPSAGRRAPTAAGWCRRSARAASRPRRTAAPDRCCIRRRPRHDIGHALADDRDAPHEIGRQRRQRSDLLVVGALHEAAERVHPRLVRDPHAVVTPPVQHTRARHRRPRRPPLRRAASCRSRARPRRAQAAALGPSPRSSTR